MNNTVLWAVLGSLIGVVLIFLVVTIFLDRRKRHKIKLKTQAYTLEAATASKKLTLYLDLIVKRNALVLAEFKPSIGQFKMADIKKSARQSLKSLKDSREYELVKAAEDQTSQDLLLTIERLLETSANSWAKTGLETQVVNLKATISEEEFTDYVAEVETKLNQVYQWTPQTV